MAKTNSQEVSVLKDIAKRLRIHSLKSTSQAGSGHPTSCLSAADLVAAIFFHAMRYDPKNPKDPNADRFVLSKGHAAPLLWAAWAEAGFIDPRELLSLRKLESPLEGHPTPRFPWVEVATGSLGQGLSVGCGMALNFQVLDKGDAKVFVLLGDGECAEGAVWEAASFASYYQLKNLIAVVDVNAWGQSQPTMYQHHLENYSAKFEACGWKTVLIDGHDMDAILEALDKALVESAKSVAIIARTEKGKGVSFLEGKEGWHGKALNALELEKALSELGEVPSVSKDILKPPVSKISHPLSKEPEPPNYMIGAFVATRAGYGEALRKLGKANSQIVVLDGDTKNSTYSEKFLKEFPDRFFECFIAEQNMVGVAVGLAARGKIPFVSTFGAFFTRAHDQIRMAGISKLPIKLCGSHAGISIGEDGPSQMALEDLAMARSIPNAAVLYPSDAVAAERLTFEASQYPGIVYLRSARPATAVLYPNETLFPIGGSKILRKSSQDRVTVVAAGVTLYEALRAHEILLKEGVSIRVIDLYSVKPLDEKTLLEAAGTTRCVITVEDHYPEGGLGEAVASTLASKGFSVHILAVNQIPRSGKPEELLRLCGIGAEHIVQKVRKCLSVEVKRGKI